MTTFKIYLENLFEGAKNDQNAIGMANYMKNNFQFLGIKKEKRTQLLNEALQLYQEEIKKNYLSIALSLFEKNYREYHYCAIEIIIKFHKKKYQVSDIIWIETIITNSSWWDSVDSIAKNILGAYLLTFPDEKKVILTNFMSSNAMWLQRSAILFQLGYKEKTDGLLLKEICLNFKDSKEFFIQKAIGWSLREYAKYNPKFVYDFVTTEALKPLSKREALKHF